MLKLEDLLTNPNFVAGLIADLYKPVFLRFHFYVDFCFGWKDMIVTHYRQWLFTIYTKKPVSERFVQMVSKKVWR